MISSSGNMIFKQFEWFLAVKKKTCQLDTGLVDSAIAYRKCLHLIVLKTCPLVMNVLLLEKSVNSSDILPFEEPSSKILPVGEVNLM